MSHLIPLRNSLPRKGKHWSQHVRDTLLLRAPSSGNFNLHIEGGAENGEFICVGEIRQDRIKYKRGKLHPGNIILEINGTPVAGYTQFDVLSLINGSNGSLELRTIKQGDQITRDLQKFLSTRFDKNTVDSDLQQTIRENLYNRTIPCTTRTPRNGEIPGVDYVFLTLEEFINLERSGNLLESGIYEGNHYGTPKPPREPHPLNNMLDDTESHRQYQSQNVKSPDSLGLLPPNWEIAYTEDNVKYFIDHSTGSTQWIDPRLALVKKATPEDCSDDELPYGWERVDDAKYGTYYIDHVNRKTQFENPVQAHRRQHESNSMSYSSAPPPHQGPPSLQSAAALAKRQEAEAHSRWPEVELFQTELPAYTVNSMGDQPRLHPFSANGQQIQEEVFRTELLKGSRGFGFTIVGGDQIGEMLQIKSIVPDGAAAKDGRLRMGDALVKVNGMSVLSKSHQDVVSMFQAMPLGEPVELELIRGYPLPFDPDDPSVETIGSYTVVRGPPARSESPLPPSSSDNSPVVSSRLSRHNHLANEWSNTSEEPMASPIAPPPVYMSSTFPRTSTTNSLPRSAPELLTVPVVKGPMGFGFTIADSPYGQRVRQILDAPRCQGLKEGDILVEINKQLIRSCTHNEAVNILKECPKGQEALIVVQRGGMPTPLKNSPAFGRRDNVMEPEVAVPRVARPKSTPVMSSNHARRDQHGGSTGNLASTGESTRNQETGYENRKLGQPALDKNSEALLNSYPSLKRAVANAARRSMENLDSPDLPPPPVTQESQTFNVHLKRGEMGFGFRIIGGQEENTQVAIGTIVRGGPADSSHQLLRGDEIHYVDGINVVGSTHRRVISLMGNAALAGEVTLGIFRNPVRAGRAPSTGTLRRSVSASSELSEATAVGSSSRQASQSTGNLSHYGRKPVPYQEETASVRSFHSTTGNTGSSLERSTQRHRRHSESDAKAEPQGPVYYRDVTLERLENESFGFVIFSSVQKSGSTIGRIIQGSPADRCRQLHVGDRLVAVNGVDIVGVYHGDIVDTIKQSGRYVTLTIAQQRPIDNFETRRLSRMSAPDLSNANGTESELNRRRDADQWNRDNAYSDQGSLERTRKDHQYYDTQNQPLQVPPKVPPRVAPKPSRETLRMVHEERRRQQNDYSDNPRQSNPEIRTRPPPPSRDNRENIKDQRRVSKQVFEVDLTRDLQGYGFSIRGGTELGLPIFVLRMAEGGAAHRDGRLKIGDEIVQINRTSTAQLAHSEAINLIKSGGNRVRLLIQRSNKPVYLDAIPNGGHAISGGGSLPRPTMKNPAYNAIYQS